MTEDSEKPLISVVVPARNEEDHITRLLKSVNKSERDDYEIVVVDGGSTDETREIAWEHGARVIEGPQKGTAVARNVG
jgi:glycosyltransferase involved in cell wall biosynthesis